MPKATNKWYVSGIALYYGDSDFCHANIVSLHIPPSTNVRSKWALP